MLPVATESERQPKRMAGHSADIQLAAHKARFMSGSFNMVRPIRQHRAPAARCG